MVTGHVYLPERTGFVHTFFLNNSAPEGRKKVFYVKNDVLRFLGEEKKGVESADAAAGIESVRVNGQTEVELVEKQNSAAVQEPIVEISAVEQFVEEVIDDSVDPVVGEEAMEVIDNLEVEALNIATDEPAAEEEKIDLVEDSSPDSPATSKGSDGKRSKRNRRKKGGKSSRSNSPSNNEVFADNDSPNEDDTPEKPKTPGSWASLVATGQPKKSGGRRSSPKSRREENNSKSSTTTSNHDKAPQDRTPKNEVAPTKLAPTSSSNTRTPEATLFIRNVPDATKEPEIRSLFEPIATSNGNKILGITLNPNKGFCFVDFDSVAAVDAVVAEAEKSLVKEPRTGRKVSSSFMVHGRVLDVERKVKENKGYKGSRGRAGMRRSPPRGR